MSHGVPFFVWRNGRPRWVPSPSLRRLGMRGRDLKDELGGWLELGDALNRAIAINRELQLTPMKGKAERRGFVYFMRAGEAVKIGYSSDPLGRAHSIQTGSAIEITEIVAVRGTKDDERTLHRRWKAYRLHGEWFRADPAVLALMERYRQRAAAEHK